jgi:hypothetical protein
MTVVPERSAWTLGSGFEAAVDLNDLSRQIERQYEAMLDATLDTVANNRPVTRSSRAAPPARRSLLRRGRATTT